MAKKLDDLQYEDRHLSEFLPWFESDIFTFLDDKEGMGLATYLPCFDKVKKKAAAKISVEAGPYAILEGTAHEIAHILDIWMRRKTVEPFFKVDYGMSFKGIYHKDKARRYVKGLEVEVGVMVIEAKLLRMAGYIWSDVEHYIGDLLQSFIGQDFLRAGIREFEKAKGESGFKNLMNPARIVKQARRLRSQDLYKAWDTVHALLKALA